MSQLHLLGALLGLSFLIWDYLDKSKKISIRWLGVFLGAFLGLLPAIPWIVYFSKLFLAGVSTGDRVWEVAYQMRFYKFWFTQPFGLGLSYALEPGGYWQTFLSFPMILGKNTKLIFLVHGVIASICLVTIFRYFHLFYRNIGKSVISTQFSRFLYFLKGAESPSLLVIHAAFFGFGILMTLKTFYIFRHYLIISAPIELAWVSYVLLSLPKNWGYRVLTILWCAQLFVSVSFLCLIHQNGGAPGAEYGTSYRSQLINGFFYETNKR